MANDPRKETARASTFLAIGPQEIDAVIWAIMAEYNRQPAPCEAPFDGLRPAFALVRIENSGAVIPFVVHQR